MKLKSTLLYSAIALAISIAQAADFTWGGGNLDWSDESSLGWNGPPPTFGDNVIINSGTVTLTTNNLTNGLSSVSIGSSGKITQTTGNTWGALNNLILSGGTLEAARVSGNTEAFGAYQISNTVTVNGTSASTISSSGSGNIFINLGLAVNDSPTFTTFNVGDVTSSSASDLTVSALLGNNIATNFTSLSAAGLIKNGAGTMTLTANNTYTGGTIVNAGVLEVSGSIAGNSFIRGAVNVNTGAELRYTGGDGTGFGFNTGNKIDTININGGLVNTQGGMTHVWGATINMTGGELRSNAGVSSQDGLRMEWFDSTVNTLASSSSALISGRINLRGDGGNSEEIFNVANGSAATDLLVSAAITEANGSVGITKNGAGTMVMSGNSNYTGATNVNAGTLVINGNISTSNVTVLTGATLGGSGTVGSLTVNEGATINPGNSPGILNVNGAYNQAGTLIAEITGTTAGSGYDQINVTGSVNLSGALTLDVTNAGTGYVLNSMIFLILNDAVDAVTGAFSNYAQGTNVGNFGGFDWVISYEADSSNSSFTGGNDVALRAIPEPSAVLLGGLGFVGLMRRRRAC